MIKGTMSESLHIRGIMSKEFSAIRCLDFNGSTDYVEVPDDDSLSFGNGILDNPFSISAWVKMNDAKNFTIIGKRDDNGPNIEWNLYTDFTGKIYFQCFDDASTKRIMQISNADIIAYEGNWIHIIGTYNGNSSETGMKIYLNGGIFASTGSSAGIYIAMSNTASTVAIGKLKSTAGFEANGMITVVRKWKRAFSPEEVKDYHNGKVPRNDLVAEWLMREQQGNIIHDTSINSNHGTIHGADWHEEKFNTPLRGIMSNSSKITGIMTAEYT